MRLAPKMNDAFQAFSRAVFAGMEKAVREMLALMQGYRA